MNVLVLSLIVTSIAILGASFFIWLKVGGRPVIVNGLIGSLALLYTAQLVGEERRMNRAFGLPMLIGMLLLGRAIGTYLRSRKEPRLRVPALMWFAVAFATLTCALAVYIQIGRTGA